MDPDPGNSNSGSLDTIPVPDPQRSGFVTPLVDVMLLPGTYDVQTGGGLEIPQIMLKSMLIQ